MLPSLTIQVSKTSDGSKDYVQITSPDQLSLNLVFVVEQVIVKDQREERSLESQAKLQARKKARRKSKSKKDLA